MSEEIKEFSFENEEYRQTYWHTCSHIMAQAVWREFPVKIDRMRPLTIQKSRAIIIPF